MEKVCRVPFGEETIINIPLIVDLEYNQIQMVNLKKPKFIVIDSNFKNFTVKPKNPDTDLGFFSVRA